ncbi:MAG: tripartite tricarboxylate transporter substrate binding protein [Burkholderiales bacterium]|nr:tripartite tricarboxylate transporter substrate binding protein [Burkholderiales bacterium]
MSLAVLAVGAAAATYPDRPVRIIVPYAAGGGTDIIARILAERMAGPLGQSVVVENKPGATGTIAAEYVAKSPADGYTLLMANTSVLTVTPHLREGLRYSPLADFEPVTLVVHQPFFLVTAAEFPASNVRELIALAKAKPGSLTYASFGPGSPPHIGGELLASATGIEMVHVPYKGGAPALVDLVGNRVSMMFVDAPPIVQHVASGKVKVLGVSTSSRTSLMPDVPAVAETVPGFSFSAWFGLVVPKGTPHDVIARLSSVVTKILADEDVRKRMAALGSDAAGEGPEAFARLIASESEKWKSLIKAKGIKAD